MQNKTLPLQMFFYPIQYIVTQILLYLKRGEKSWFYLLFSYGDKGSIV